ncbi:beta-lactamase family protein [Aestuariibacter halophilus]|uniref:Beta-lactamase family protein n=1 Tax=Fluctibacter halophilus TaxID=226011 RepID=A0ABS8GC51_9ALTE|nr:serine hydrolase [Aestuariibacter halophilus]MCC2617831.1 beta-lactamase family protein [Aestuariibacter halophilus]
MKHWKGISAIVLVVVLTLTASYWSNLQRLYMAVTLYDEDKIVENFRSMYTRFNAKTIPASSQPFAFPTAPGTLPDTFALEGQSLRLNDFLQDSGTTGLMVIKDGVTRVENYYLGETATTQHISFSMGKSFVSALFGMALAEGKIASIEDAVTDYVPELRGSGYDGVRIKDVLQMSSGVGFNEDYGDFNSDINRFSRAIALGTSLDAFTASLHRERAPGTYNHYVSIDTQVLGMVLDRVLDVSLTEYLQRRIWEPLGMQDEAYWLADDNGMELALGGLNVTLRDYAKFGWLYANGGRWQGQQLVPQQWVTDSVTPDAPHLMPGADNPLSSSPYGYGYQWWIPTDADDEFMAQGIYHQFIYIDPDQQLVIVKLSANHRFNDKSHQWRKKHLALFRAIGLHYQS